MKKLRAHINMGIGAVASVVGGAVIGASLFVKAARMKADERVDWLLDGLDRLREVDAPRESTACEGCGEYGYGFMLRDDVWEQIETNAVDHPGFEENFHHIPQLLCLWCCEIALGRQIAAADFDEWPINGPIMYVLHMPQPMIERPSLPLDFPFAMHKDGDDQ